MTSGCSHDPGPERQEGYDETHEQCKPHKPEGTNTPDTSGGCRMSRGHPPLVAIEEAMRHAEHLGSLVSGVNAAQIPCDFMAIHDGQITLVRVRRLRYARYEIRDIALSCKRDILELRGMPVSDDTGRELWVRGPDRHWHRYLISPDRIEVSDWDLFGVRSSRHLGQQMLQEM